MVAGFDVFPDADLAGFLVDGDAVVAVLLLKGRALRCRLDFLGSRVVEGRSIRHATLRELGIGVPRTKEIRLLLLGLELEDLGAELFETGEVLFGAADVLVLAVVEVGDLNGVLALRDVLEELLEVGSFAPAFRAFEDGLAVFRSEGDLGAVEALGDGAVALVAVEEAPVVE